MSSKSLNLTLFAALKWLTILVILSFAALFVWGGFELNKLKKSTESGWFDPPTKIYTSPLKLVKNQKISPFNLSEILIETGLQERGSEQSLGDKEFTFTSDGVCKSIVDVDLNPNTRSCFFIQLENETFLLEFSINQILKVWKLSPEGSLQLDHIYTPPLLIAQISKNKHILRTYKNLSQIPRYCLDSVLAIEDDRFLKHKGISIKGILRAVITNLKAGGFRQGGSTLTQQLVKNKFLTSKKTLTRKVKEAWLSILLELVLEKDEILESYLNYIYWGANGAYSIHGIEEASQLYFGKTVSRLNLSECSLLAGSVKGPGIYGPHRPKSKERQLKVLTRMEDLNLISSNEKQAALENQPEIKFKSGRKKIQAPYYIDAVYDSLKKLGFDDLAGLSIYTEMDYFAQKSLEASIDSFLKGRSKGFQGSVLIGDNSLNSVVALSSGTSNSLNFNSAIYAKRHIGSLAKPFVYMTALEQDSLGFHPLTDISNESFTYKYEGQSWTPRNYSAKNQEPSYPLFISLAKSKNIPTIKLMSLFGYKKVYKNLLKYGFQKFSPITPSLALGAFDSSPLEVLKAYINLAKDSENPNKELPHFVRKVMTESGDTLHSSLLGFNNTPNINPSRRMTLEIMKNTLVLGTAKRSQNLRLHGIYGGKTGTTNDHKDGWFASVSPNYTSVVWVGKAPYLTDRGIKLTGATAALPIWMSFAKQLENTGRYSEEDWFTDDSLTHEPPVDSEHLTPDVQLLFRKD